MKKCLCLILCTGFCLNLFSQKIFLFSNVKGIEVKLIDSTIDEKNHIFQFVIKNNSQESIFLLGNNDSIYDFAVSYSDSSGVLIGFGAKYSPLYLTYAEYYSVYELKPNSQIKTRLFSFETNQSNYTLEIGFDFVRKKKNKKKNKKKIKKKITNQVLISDYRKECESINMVIRSSTSSSQK